MQTFESYLSAGGDPAKLQWLRRPDGACLPVLYVDELPEPADLSTLPGPAANPETEKTNPVPRSTLLDSSRISSGISSFTYSALKSAAATVSSSWSAARERRGELPAPAPETAAAREKEAERLLDEGAVPRVDAEQKPKLLERPAVMRTELPPTGRFPPGMRSVVGRDGKIHMIAPGDEDRE